MSSSEESAGEAILVLSRRCSCCARYWDGVCLAALAQCSSSRCSRGRLALKRGGSGKQFSWYLGPIQKGLGFHKTSLLVSLIFLSKNTVIVASVIVQW